MRKSRALVFYKAIILPRHLDEVRRWRIFYADAPAVKVAEILQVQEQMRFSRDAYHAGHTDLMREDSMPTLDYSNCMRLSILGLVLLLAAGCSKSPIMSVDGGNAERGKQLIQDYGCVACHSIPGIPHHGSNVGPSLSKMGKRVYVGGVLPNVPDELVRWLRNPPEVDPRTAMPNVGLSEAEAKDIASYLYTLH